MKDGGPNRELLSAIAGMWRISADKIRLIERTYDPARGSPVFTKNGVWTSRGWTEWTQGFQYGSCALQFDAASEDEFLEICRSKTVDRMGLHVTHVGVHDHGFNNISTYGNLLRLMNEGRIPENPWERRFYELALKASGAVQAARWTATAGGGGFIHSFNGPHSLFVDTLRTLRSLAAAHSLGHALMEENDRRVSLLHRLIDHARATAKFSVYYGEGRDAYDVRGRVAHESVFNSTDGAYRCPGTQQGYSPFTTWTRGLAWAILGFAEELEFISELAEDVLAPFGGKADITAFMRRALEAASDYYLANSAADGIPYWDTGAPGLERLGDWRSKPADPFNSFEPVDSSAAAIACQGLMRFGVWLETRGEEARGAKYRDAGLSVLTRLLKEPYLSVDGRHQGLLLHSVYHKPNGWDHVPEGRRIPCGESSMWGDYHLREAALYAQRMLAGGIPLVFWRRKETA